MKERELEGNLEAWKVLCLMVQTGSVKTTAEILGLDQSKVSRLISRLESGVGYSLFDKNFRPFKPTDRCMVVASLASEALKNLQKIESFSKGGGAKTTIRVSAPVEPMQLYYAPKFFQYSQKFANVQFSICPEATAEQLLNDEVDVAVVNRRPRERPELIVRPLMNASTCVLATPQYLEKYGCPKAPEDLIEHQGLLQRTNFRPITISLNKGGVESRMIFWKKMFITHDQLTLQNLLLQHKGITVDLYIAHVKKEIQERRVVPILPGWEKDPFQICILTRREKEMNSEELRNFVDWWTLIETNEAMERQVTARMAVQEAWKYWKSTGKGWIE